MIETIIGISLPVITYLIGRYQNYQKAKEIQTAAEALKLEIARWRDSSIETQKEVNRLLDYCEQIEGQLKERERIASKALADLANAPKFQVVNNTQKHPAANDKYLYVEGEINGTREAGLLRLSQWNEAKETLSKNPEDKPL